MNQLIRFPLASGYVVSTIHKTMLSCCSKHFGAAILLAGVFLISLSGSVLAQVPQLLNFQGRVISGGTNFEGTGQFKFSLVNSNGTMTFWSNDGTGSGGNPPSTAVSLPVVRGLYSVLLGNATLPGMTLLPTTIFTNNDLRLRVWFNDGFSGFQLLSPDQRLAAVGYAIMAASVQDGAVTAAKLADGAVTSEKLSSEVRSGLGGAPSGGIVLSADPNSTNLASSGFMRLGGIRAVTEDWQQLVATTELSFTGPPSPTNYWNGSQALLWNLMGSMPGAPVAARYHPGSNVWMAVDTNGMPTGASPGLSQFWTGTELYVFATDPMKGLAAARYNPNSNVWIQINTNGAIIPSMYTVTAWTGTKLIVWSPAIQPLPAPQVQGAVYNPTTDTWSNMTTNGAPFGMGVFYSTWIGPEWLVLVDGPSKTGAFYNPVTDTWRAMNLAGMPTGATIGKAIWTGSELIYLVENTGSISGAYYRFAVDAWYNLNTNNTPAFSAIDSKLYWTGSELIVWKPGTAMMGTTNGGRFNPQLNRWTPMTPLDISGTPTSVSSVWTGTELVVVSYDGAAIKFGARYNLQNGQWTLIPTYSMPNFTTGSSGSPGLWTGAEILFFSTTPATFQKYVIKYTPSQALYLYQKP